MCGPSIDALFSALMRGIAEFKEWFTMKKTAAILCWLVLSACTNQQLYEAGQHNQQLKCQELPQNQYEECMARASESYQDYSQKRREAIADE